MIKITNINIPITGTSVSKQVYGNVGKEIEDKLEQYGFEINRGPGTDLPGLEVKTRKENSSSAHTVGTMTAQAIKNTHWHSSPVRNKIQRQYRVSYNDDGNIVTGAETIDFSSSYIQKQLERSYESARAKIISSDSASYIRGDDDCIGYFEKKTGTSYAFRISHAGMKKIISVTKNKFSEIFES
jgi:hypothetical protein